MKTPFRIGTATYLRPVERTDAATIQPWMNDLEVTRNLTRFLPISLQAQEAFLDGMGERGDVVLGIADKASDALVGVCGLHDLHWQTRQAAFGITVGDKAAQGKGHGTEATRLMVGFAFETLNLNRVWLKVYEGNDRAARVYEKAGFRKEGVLRDDAFRDGRYRDSIVYGILRAEWKP